MTVNVSGTSSVAACDTGAVATGDRSELKRVVAEPLSALPAVNVTGYGAPAASPVRGVQVSVPEVLEASVTNDAWFPGGSADRSAASPEIGSPSGSDAVTVTVTVLPSSIGTVAGAVTTGARSTFATAIEVVAVPENAFAAVNATA